MHTHTNMLTQQAHACWQTCNRCIWLLGEWVCCVFVCLQLERVCLCVWERVSVCVCSCCRMRNPLSHLPAKKYFTIHETIFFWRLCRAVEYMVWAICYPLSHSTWCQVYQLSRLSQLSQYHLSACSYTIHGIADRAVIADSCQHRCRITHVTTFTKLTIRCQLFVRPAYSRWL